MVVSANRSHVGILSRSESMSIRSEVKNRPESLGT